MPLLFILFYFLFFYCEDPLSGALSYWTLIMFYFSLLFISVSFASSVDIIFTFPNFYLPHLNWPMLLLFPLPTISLSPGIYIAFPNQPYRFPRVTYRFPLFKMTCSSSKKSLSPKNGFPLSSTFPFSIMVSWTQSFLSPPFPSLIYWFFLYCISLWILLPAFNW